jgi:multidrug resistance efflux pump
MQAGASLVTITNSRAERGRLDDVRRLIDEMEGETKVMQTRRSDLQREHEELIAHVEAFQIGRMRQLDARVAEVASDATAAEATRDATNSALVRAQALFQAGTGTKVILEKARRDAAVASEALAVFGHRRAAIEVELSALRQGVYVGDSYNDRPQSQQRADDIASKLSDLAAEISRRQERLAAMRAELADESSRYAERAAATLVAPVRGSIWEVMTAPGETVVRGQDLVRLLDCTGVVVTATVGETAYNHLHLGAPARFRFRGEGIDYEGRITGLTGVAAAPANLAIQPASLAKEPYRVTVALPDLAKPGECRIGRTGRVTFSN